MILGKEKRNVSNINNRKITLLIIFAAMGSIITGATLLASHDLAEVAASTWPAEYENAQKRILDVFSKWKAPANFKIESFVVRVGEWGGHMLVDCDDPLAVHKVCSTFPAFEFQARPVIAVNDAVRVELEAIAWRDGLKE